MGGETEQKDIKGKNVRCWWLPNNLFEKKEPIPVPKPRHPI